MKLKPRPRIIIIDRRGEYSVLSEYGALIFDYRSFLPRPKDIEPGLLAEILADLLGVPSGDKTIRDYIGEVVRKIRKDMSEGVDVDFTPETLEEYVERLSRAKESTKERLRLYLNRRRLSRILLLDQARPYHDIVEVLKDHPIVVVDLSTDPNVIYQHLTVAKMIRRVVRYAIERARRREPFAAIFVIEEAQYIAPEKGLKIEVGEPEKIGADKALVEGVSQAGGYNVGFIIMTQRPAYVMKSVISQCNTILCFRLRNPNDQDTISRYTEYGGEEGLAGACACGRASGGLGTSSGPSSGLGRAPSPTSGASPGSGGTPTSLSMYSQASLAVTVAFLGYSMTLVSTMTGKGMVLAIPHRMPSKSARPGM